MWKAVMQMQLVVNRQRSRSSVRKIDGCPELELHARPEKKACASCPLTDRED